MQYAMKLGWLSSLVTFLAIFASSILLSVFRLHKSYFDEAVLESSVRDDEFRVKGALVLLCRNKDLPIVKRLVKSFERTFNHVYKYPYLVFNDSSFDSNFKDTLSSLTDASIEYFEIDKSLWSIPPHIDVDLAKANWTNEPGDRGASYRHMCRFYSGLLPMHPSLDKYDYYWRLDADAVYYCDIPYDPFWLMKKWNKKYAFTMVLGEQFSTIRTLWQTTVKFMESHSDLLHPNSFIKSFVNPKSNYYNLCQFWNNFEIVSVGWLRSPEYQSYFRFLDQAGGFYYERWGDAPIRTLAAGMLLEPRDVHYFRDIGYFHYPHIAYPAEERFPSRKCMPAREPHCPFSDRCGAIFRPLFPDEFTTNSKHSVNGHDL